MSDYNNRPAKRKCDWTAPSPGHRDNDKMAKSAGARDQQVPKSTAPSARSDPTANNEKAAPSGATTEPFRPLMRELQRLDHENPVLAELGARLVALYQRLWESYIAKHADSSRLEKENSQLRLAHARVVDEKGHIERHCREQEARLARFQEVFRKVHDGVMVVFEEWENSKAEPSAGGSAKEITHEREKPAVTAPTPVST